MSSKCQFPNQGLNPCIERRSLCPWTTSVWVAQSCLTLCDPQDCSPPGSSVRGILQARILEWVVMSSSGGSSRPRDRTHISCISRWIFFFFNTVPPGKPLNIITVCTGKLKNSCNCFTLVWNQTSSMAKECLVKLIKFLICKRNVYISFLFQALVSVYTMSVI